MKEDDAYGLSADASRDYVVARLCYWAGVDEAFMEHTGACVEKLMKSFLLLRGEQDVRRYAHKFEKLRLECVKHDASFFSHQGLTNLCQFFDAGGWEAMRYPQTRTRGMAYCTNDVLEVLDWFYWTMRELINPSGAKCMDYAHAHIERNHFRDNLRLVGGTLLGVITYRNEYLPKPAGA
jgi:hypothetical protein